MAVVKIDGKEYDTEKLPKEALELINSIAFVDAELQRLQNQQVVLRAAKTYYMEKLKPILEKIDSKNESDKISFS